MRVPRQNQNGQDPFNDEDDDDDIKDDDLIEDEDDEPDTRSVSTLPRENGSGSSGFKDSRGRDQPSFIGELYTY